MSDDALTCPTHGVPVDPVERLTTTGYGTQASQQPVVDWRCPVDQRVLYRNDNGELVPYDD